MINKEIISNKLKNLTGYLDEIDPLLKLETGFLLSTENYKDLRALEREFQLIVDTMIEINSHIISKQNLGIPDDYTNTFISLGSNAILPMDFSGKIAAVVGLRNKIVHKYDVIDQKKFLDDLKANSVQFNQYVSFIQTYINSL